MDIRRCVANNTSSEVVDIPGSSVILIVNFNHKTDKTLTAEIFFSKTQQKKTK